LWGYLFGPGIIEPIDDIRAGNPASNPELLDALTKDFIASGFDAQHMLKTICKSRAYQLSVKTNKWNEDDTLNYSRAMPRRLPAEVLYDAVHLATGSIERFPGLPAGMRASELPDSGVSDAFLDDFGKPVRESACECERSSGMVLGPIMKLINGPTVANAIADPASELNQLVATEKDDSKLIQEIFVRFLARNPTPQEIQLGLNALKGSAAEHDKAVAALAEYEKTIPAKQAAWELTAGKPVIWTVLDPSEMKSTVGATFKKNDDKSISVGGPTGKDVYTIVAATDVVGITGIRLEALNDAALPGGGPGRPPNGNFVVSEFMVTAAPKADPAKAAAVGLQNASADFSQDMYGVAGAIDGNDATGWAVSLQLGKPHTALFETKADVKHDGGTLLTVTLSQQFQDGMHSLGKFRLSVATGSRPLTGPNLPAELAAALGVPADKRNDTQKKVISDYFRAQDSELVRLAQTVQREAEQLKNARSIGTQDLAWALINNPAFLFNR